MMRRLEVEADGITLCFAALSTRLGYLIHSPLPGALEGKAFAELLDELRRQYLGWLIPVYEGEDRRFVIFEVQPHMDPAAVRP